MLRVRFISCLPATVIHSLTSYVYKSLSPVCRLPALFMISFAMQNYLPLASFIHLLHYNSGFAILRKKLPNSAIIFQVLPFSPIFLLFNSSGIYFVESDF